MNEWSELVFLLGAAAGYGAFMIFQPYRWALGESYQVMRDYPCLWLVVGVFESVRITVVTIAPVLGEEVAPEQFLGTAWPGPVPYVSELILPALEAGAGGMLRLATVLVDAWPVSLVLAAALIWSPDGALRGRWGEPGKKKRFADRGFAFLVAGAAGLYLGVALLGWLSAGRLPGEGPVATAIDGAGRLFEVGCAVAVQVWIILWTVELRRGDFRGVPPVMVFTRTGSLLLMILVYWGVLEGWGAGVIGEGRAARLAIPGAAVAALWLLPAVIRTVGGEAGLLRSVVRYGFWICSYFERVFWWLAAAGVHLFLLFLCGKGMETAFGGAPWALWIWEMFYAFLKAGVIVWLLGAFVVLVEESQEVIAVPKRSKKRKAKRK